MTRRQRRRHERWSDKLWAEISSLDFEAKVAFWTTLVEMGYFNR